MDKIFGSDTGWPGHPRFYQLIEHMAKIHASKNQDYATSTDPLKNFRGASELGIEPWLGALLRMSDKFARLQTFACTRKLNNEGVADTLLDLAVYSLITLILFEEARPKSEVT